MNTVSDSMETKTRVLSTDSPLLAAGDSVDVLSTLPVKPQERPGLSGASVSAE